MSQWVAYAKLQEEANKAEGRRHPRFVAHSFNCEKGVVSDFSATGLRITYRKDQKLEAGDVVMLELFSPKGQHNCSARVMWIKHPTKKHYEVGFQFCDPEAAKQIRLFEVGFDPMSEGTLDR